MRLGLDGLVRNHLEAVNRAKAVVAEGRDDAERRLADRVLDVQAPAVQELSALG